MKKNVFFATILVAGILTVGIAQYPTSNNQTSATTVQTLNDTVPEKPNKDTTVPAETDSSAIRF
jgi:hypothetical protein